MTARAPGGAPAGEGSGAEAWTEGAAAAPAESSPGAGRVRGGSSTTGTDAPAPAPSLDELLAHVTAPAAAAPLAPAAESAPVVRSARIVSMSGAEVLVALRGQREPIAADVAAEVDRELVERALASGDAVLVEQEPGERPVIVGVLQTRIPSKLELRAETIHIEADREVLLRAGTAALRIREDGDVELVGSRILHMSRGLFRLVGRVLRLN